MLNERDMWSYRSSNPAVEPIDGFKIEARDGSIGRIDHATYETGESWVVVDTGPWILGRKVLIPAGLIDRVDLDDEKVYVDLTKDQIKDSPEYDPDAIDEGYRDRLGSYYS